MTTRSGIDRDHSPEIRKYGNTEIRNTEYYTEYKEYGILYGILKILLRKIEVSTILNKILLPANLPSTQLNSITELNLGVRSATKSSIQCPRSSNFSTSISRFLTKLHYLLYSSNTAIEVHQLFESVSANQQLRLELS